MNPVLLANPVQDWFKKWWLWIVVGASTAAYFALKFLAAPARGKIEILEGAKKDTLDLKEQKQVVLQELNTKMEARRTELKEIQTIPSEEERLKALSDFANRRKQ